jgi:hAT family C-terminal dimerisation region
MRWKAFWQRQGPDERPNCVAGALRHATDMDTYPALAVLLHIFATLPVTTATGERSFSALKYLKNYLRLTMGETRLNGLAHLT